MARVETYVVLFDGHCAFCRSQAARLERWGSRTARVVARDFQDPAVLAQYPSLTHADCMKAMRLVAPDGRTFAGAEAVARLLMTRWWAMPFAVLFFLPGIRELANAGYAAVAKRRYEIAKRSRRVVCDGTTCSVHFE